MTAGEMLTQQQAVIAHLTTLLLNGASSPSGSLPWNASEQEIAAAHALAVRIYNMSGPNRWTGNGTT